MHVCLAWASRPLTSPIALSKTSWCVFSQLFYCSIARSLRPACTPHPLLPSLISSSCLPPSTLAPLQSPHCYCCFSSYLFMLLHLPHMVVPFHAFLLFLTVSIPSHNISHSFSFSRVSSALYDTRPRQTHRMLSFVLTAW